MRAPLQALVRGAVLAALAVFGVALSGCSPEAGSDKAEVPDAAATPSPAIDLLPGAQVVHGIERGVKGGSLVMGMADEPKTLNPPLATDVLSTAVSDLLFDRLFDFDRHTQQIVPELAESWEYVPESREWVFHLREGLNWSDGTPLTSDDFLFAAEAIFDPSVPTHIRELLQVEGKPFTFRAPDPRTFIAAIPAVDSTAFLQMLNIQAMPRQRYGAALKEGKFVELLNTSTPPGEVVSSGPFVLKQYIPGDRLVFAPNPYYYRHDEWGTQLPYLEEFVMLSVPNFEAMALRFQAGDLDILEDPIQPQNLTALQDGQAEGGYTVYNPGLAFRNNHYWFNLKPGGTYADDSGERVAWTPARAGDEPPADLLARDFRYYVDPRKRAWFEREEFRRACSMATDREAMARTVYYGQAEPLYGFETPANKVWFNPDIPRFPHDPEAAGRLLDGIGLRDRNGDGLREDAEGRPLRITLITNKENAVRERVGVLLKEDLRRVGLDVSLQLLDFNNIITRIQDSFDYEACLLGLSGGVPPHPVDGANILLSRSSMHQWNPGQKTPATPWEARIDELFAAFRASFDEAEQRRLYREIQVVWAEHQPMIHTVVDRLWIACSNGVGNLKPSPLRPYLTHNVEELYVKTPEAQP